MNMNFLRKLTTPQEIKVLYPLSDELKKIKEKNDEEIRKRGCPENPLKPKIKKA